MAEAPTAPPTLAKRLADWSPKVVAVGLCLYCTLYFSGILFELNLAPEYVSHRAIFLAFILTLTFLTFSVKRGTPRAKVPWYDILLIIASITVCLYPAFLYETLLEHYQELIVTPEERVFAIVGMLLVIEAARRVAGWPVAIIAFFFMIYPMVCQYFPGVLHGRGYSLDRIAMGLYQQPEGMFGTIVGIAATVIVAFIIFGAIFVKTGAGDFLSNLAFSILGTTRGGPAKASVVASSLFGMFVGQGTANIATTGVITIPLMIKSGYKPETAGAIECVASNGGHFTPPVMGAVAFIIAQFLGVSYVQVCIWALLPSVLYYIAVFIQVDLFAARDNLRGLPRKELPSIRSVLKDGWYLLIPLCVLIFFLIILKFHPEKSAMITIIALILVTQVTKRRRLGWNQWVAVATSAGKTICIIGGACAAANIIAASAVLTGLSVRIPLLVSGIAGDNILFLLFLTAVTTYILGMGLSGIALYVTMAIMVVPIVVDAGIPPIAAHLFVYMMGCTAGITPPVAMLCFIAAPMAGSTVYKVGWSAMRLGIVTYFIPFFFCFSPALLLIGSAGEVALAAITAIIGVSALAAGVAGFFLKELSWYERIPLMVGGLLFAFPGLITDGIGGLLISTTIIWHVAKWVREKRRAVAS
ncbi:TRAP transporter permease [Chloroflexota bacterium]